jgi:hypothetical protein
VLSLLLILAAGWLAAASFLVLQLRLAPVGVEDADGFHVTDVSATGALPPVVAIRVF